MKTILESRLSAHLMCAAILLLFAASPSRAHAQGQYNSPSRVSPFEVSMGYNAIRANAPVGGCGCFYMQGGRAEVGFPVFRWVGGVAEVGGGYADHINSFGDGVARMTYLFGPRVTHKAGHRATVFAQTLFGGAHGFDGYFPTARSSSSSANSFAFSAGGGVELNLSSHLGVRVLQADYLYTELPNAKGDMQNNLRIGAGFVIRVR